MGIAPSASADAPYMLRRQNELGAGASSTIGYDRPAPAASHCLDLEQDAGRWSMRFIQKKVAPPKAGARALMKPEINAMSIDKTGAGAMGRLRPKPAKGDAVAKIALPAPDKTGGMPLMEATAKRPRPANWQKNCRYRYYPACCGRQTAFRR